MITSANSKVSIQRVQRVFSHFCRVSIGRTNSNVNLTLTGTFIRLRNKIVAISDIRKGKAIFAISVPVRVIRRRSMSQVRRPRAARPAIIRRLRRARARRELPSRGGRYVLVVSSGTSMHNCIGSLLGRRCAIVRTTSKRTKLGGTVGCIPSTVVYSIVVPIVSKLRYYEGLGVRLRASRVPIVLLATYSLSRRQVRKFRYKTSSCVSGPFGSGLLLIHLQGLVSGRGQLGRFFKSGVALSGRSMDRISGKFIRHFERLVRTGLASSRLDIRRLNDGVKLDEIRLCHGVGSLAGCSPGRLIHVTELGGTTSLLTSSRGAVSRVACRMNFASPSCFAGYCGRCFKRDPASFLGHEKWL